MDASVKPMRGQMVIVENESHGQFVYSGDSDMVKDIGECCYIIDRPAGTLFGVTQTCFKADDREYRWWHRTGRIIIPQR